MRVKRALVAGTLLVGAGAVIAFLDESWTGAAAVSMVLVGLAVAMWALSTRDDGAARSRDAAGGRHRVATALIVVIGVAAGVMSAATDNDAWFAVAVFLALLIWSLQPGLMD